MSKFHIPENTIYICQGSKCSKKGSRELYKNLKHYLKSSGMKDDVELIITECTDRCKFAPVLSAQPANIWLKEYTSKDVLKLLEDILKKEI
ncbi:MAG: (2Fe-2S) ferredoxin domain-containing protein [Daejeonella sp.]